MQGDRGGPHRLVNDIGSGAMGEVFRAWDESLKRWVAIKQNCLDDEDQERHQRFRREAQAAADLNHPTIVQIYHVLETEVDEWIVMEHVEDATVASLLERPAVRRLHGDGAADRCRPFGRPRSGRVLSVEVDDRKDRGREPRHG